MFENQDVDARAKYVRRNEPGDPLAAELQPYLARPVDAEVVPMYTSNLGFQNLVRPGGPNAAASPRSCPACPQFNP